MTSTATDLLLTLVGVGAVVAVTVLLLEAGDVAAGRRRARRPGRVLRVAWARRRRGVAEPLPTSAPDDRPRPAVVVNPTKFEDVDAVRATVTRVCEGHGWAEPLWLGTTAEEPGAAQARAAVVGGADVVMACGGDGTVRAVAEGLAGTGVALGLLPAGTGNLLARNLDLDLDDLEAAVATALTGDDRAVDVGLLSVDDEDDERVFLVMAGMGFDARIMDAPERLKANLGPAAYTVSGVRNLRGRRARVRLGVDDDPEATRRVRTVVIGNCGRLLGGVVLMPDARIDDGWLDVVTLAPRGLAGWVGVAARVLTRRRRDHPLVEHWRGRAISVRAEQPEPAQMDGDPIGDVTSLRARVRPGALLVRVPAR